MRVYSTDKNPLEIFFKFPQFAFVYYWTYILLMYWYKHLARSHGLRFKANDSPSRHCEFQSRHHIAYIGGDWNCYFEKQRNKRCQLRAQQKMYRKCSQIWCTLNKFRKVFWDQGTLQPSELFQNIVLFFSWQSRSNHIYSLALSIPENREKKLSIFKRKQTSTNANIEIVKERRDK